MANYQFKTTNIKGKEYVEVNERIKFFRLDEQYKGYCLESELVHLTNETVCVKAVIKDASDRIVATGFAYEEKGASRINSTSYVENCETSAWGRALANLGIGIDTSIASSIEVANAIVNQKSSGTTTATNDTDVFQKSVDYIKNAKSKTAKETAYNQVLAKYGANFSDKQKLALKKFV
jgi:hypothetical protein